MQVAGAYIRPLFVGDEKYRDIEAMVKLIAITVQGVELAVGLQAARVLGSLMGRYLYNEYRNMFEGKDFGAALEMVNTRSFRVDLYPMHGKLVHIDPQVKQKAFYLIGRECPIRQILYHEDLPAGRTLCKVLCSFLEMLISDKLGGKYSVSLQRYGPNACFIRVVIREGAEPPESLRVYSVKPSLEEYVEKLREDLTAIMRAFDAVVDKVLGGNPAMSYMAGKKYGALDGNLLLSYLGRLVTLEEAIEVINAAYAGILRVRREGDNLIVEESLFHQLPEKLNLGKAVFVYRSLQGYLAGVLETLTGQRVDLRALDSKATRFKIIAR